MAAPTGAIIKPLCHSENGKIPKTSAENNRADAKAIFAILNADRFPPAGGEPDEVASRTADICNADQHASAKKNYSIVTGRAPAIATI